MLLFLSTCIREANTEIFGEFSHKGWEWRGAPHIPKTFCRLHGPIEIARGESSKIKPKFSKGGRGDPGSGTQNPVYFLWGLPLVHLLKYFRAYSVKSSTTLFLNNVQ